MNKSQFLALAHSVVVDPAEREHRREFTRRTRRMRRFVADMLGDGEHHLQIYWPGPPTNVIVEDSDVYIADAAIDLEDVVEQVERQGKVVAKIEVPVASADERAALKASIGKFGVIYPAVYDRWGWLLDGRLRRQLAAELGVSCPTVTLGALDPADRRQLALDLDLCRKQSSRKGRRLTAQVLLKRSPSTSNRQIARAVGVDHKTIGNYRQEMESAGEIPHLDIREGEDGKTYRLPKIVAANGQQHHLAQRAARLLPESNNGKIMDVVTASRQARREKKKRKKLAAANIVAPAKDDDIQIYHCPYQELKIEAETASLVLTDIPYDGSFLPQLDELAQLAERSLVDGGLFVTYVGHLYLPQYLDAFGRYLTYRWIMANTWEGGANMTFAVNAASRWKPFLVFSKGDWRKRDNWYDTVGPTAKEKEYHDWQQPLPDIERLVRLFSEPGNLVVDPCGGGFTTAAACLNLGRRCISCDVDEEAVRSGQKRLAKMRDKSDN